MATSGLLLVAATAAVKSIVEKQVMPSLSRLASAMKLDFDSTVESLGKHFEQYLSRTYEKLSILNVLVFRNQQKKLRDLYIPLSLIREGLKSSSKEDIIEIDGYPREFINHYRRVLITDTAGMGKSTLTKIMFLSAIDQQEGIPFYIELRKLSKRHSLLEEIRDQLNSLTKDFNDDLMRKFFQSGGFIFFFDGFDEISLADRGDVTDDLKRFIEKAPNNFYILTSRFEQALAGFGDFLSMRICPLSKKNAFSLLRKYDSGGETSKRLIEKIESLHESKINDFLTNPLLVSLLFIGFDYKPEIPLKIHLFYDQVFEAYFNTHDLSKDGHYIHEKKSGLDMADFSKVLRSIGFICLSQNRLEYNREDLLQVIEKAGKLSCVQIKSTEDLMHDLLHAVPLFCQDGINYKWVHKSMQEYYAADFINRDSGDNKENILTSVFNSSELNNYMNILELYSDLDNKMFSKVFVLPILNDFIEFVERPLSVKNDDRASRVMRRRQIIYNRDAFLYFFTKEESKMSIADSFQLMYQRIESAQGSIEGVRHSVINRVNPDAVRGTVFILGKYGKLVDLIERKYPEIVSKKSKLPLSPFQHVQPGIVYHVTEELGIDSPDLFDELDACVLHGEDRHMDYDSAKSLRNTIVKTLSENENVFKDLFSLK